MGKIERTKVFLKKKITRHELINWAEEKGVNFNDDLSIEAIKYHLYDFKNDLIKHFNNTITFHVESVTIDKIDEIYVNIIFEIEESYPSFHKPKKNEIKLIMVKDANLYNLNYSGFEIDFKTS